MATSFDALRAQLSGDIRTDQLHKILYATDASVYRALPQAVIFPKHQKDIQKVVNYCWKHRVPIVPRAAGTSLAGQCVGEGIVLDTSRYMNRILEVNPEEGWARVQPGVIRDELNHHLRAHGLCFGPNTSTANRATIGGMVGNNSCGSSSIIYGTTRQHLLEVTAVLSDGSPAVFGPLDPGQFRVKMEGEWLENRLYRHIYELLSHPDNQTHIRRHFPHPTIQRRNTGYALDQLLAMQPFDAGGAPFNFSSLLAGSEGTLAITTEIKIALQPLLPPAAAVVAIHFRQVIDALRAVEPVLDFRPSACELMDKTILDCTRENIAQQRNRFFLEGDPQAVLLVEVRGANPARAWQEAERLADAMRARRCGYAFPIIEGEDTQRIWALRKAGLGVLSNLPGDAKPVACIEDTAVRVADLPAYIEEFTQLMEGFGQKAVYYAHAGDGELHLRPILNLKDPGDRSAFKAISEASARLVKKYRGSLSGEHGDGRVRAPFIPLVLGEENYELLRLIKQHWDPFGLFNPGKIVDAAPMDESFRYASGQDLPQVKTFFDWSADQGILRAAERCNGSGDCRKLALSGGTMCPSYMATREEKDTTRARANALREMLTHHRPEFLNPFQHEDLYEVLDLCLSCKGCTSECPSNVDMSTMKAEFLYQYYQGRRRPLRMWAIANIGRLNRLAAWAPPAANFLLTQPVLSRLVKKSLGLAPDRSLPKVHRSLRSWYWWNRRRWRKRAFPKGAVQLYCDEFTDINDRDIGIAAIRLLINLGYRVHLGRGADSGRAHISNGMLDEARNLARANVLHFADRVNANVPLVGIEPSAILGFRDEYPKLVGDDLKEKAQQLGEYCYTLEGFLWREAEAGRIGPSDFTERAQHIVLHGHCHQKALDGITASAMVLDLPKRFTVEHLPTGCCGMAGSFGYEAEHHALSMQIGDLVLFPALRQIEESTWIAAPGTSCRHQIFDGTGLRAMHPAEILWKAFQER